MLKKGVVLFLVILLAIYFRGWTSVRYDEHDSVIGEEIIFVEPMLFLSNLPDSYAGKEIAERYGSIIVRKSLWPAFRNSFPQVTVEEIDGLEVFAVEKLLYLKPVGILEKAFSSGTLKYYVIASNDHKSTVVRVSEYEPFSKIENRTFDGANNVSPNRRGIHSR